MMMLSITEVLTNFGRQTGRKIGPAFFAAQMSQIKTVCFMKKVIQADLTEREWPSSIFTQNASTARWLSW